MKVRIRIKKLPTKNEKNTDTNAQLHRDEKTKLKREEEYTLVIK